MSSTTPLTDAINALITYSNEITGASDATLSDAVESLAAGYGGTEHEGEEWTEKTITTAATNTAGCINILFPNRQPYHYYVAQLVKKNRDNYAANQLIQYTCVTDSSQNASTGCGTRWRDNALSSYASVASYYDAVVEVGDIYLVSQTAYTIGDT